MTTNTHKQTTTILVAALFVLAAALPALADIPSVSQTNVPFAFEAGTAQFPAGNYTIQRSLGSGIIVIRGESGAQCAVITSPLGDPNTATRPHLLFERLGDSYRLAEVWLPGGAMGARIPPTKQQKLLIAKGKTQSGGSEVIVALH